MVPGRLVLRQWEWGSFGYVRPADAPGMGEERGVRSESWHQSRCRSGAGMLLVKRGLTPGLLSVAAGVARPWRRWLEPSSVTDGTDPWRVTWNNELPGLGALSAPNVAQMVALGVKT